MLYIMGAATGMPARTAGSGGGMPAKTVGSRIGAGMPAITVGFKTGAGMLGITAGVRVSGAGITALAASTAGSGVGMPARTVGSRMLGVAVTGGRGKDAGVKVDRGSGGGDVAISWVGVSDKLGAGEATVATSGAAAVPNIGTSGCKGWLAVLVTTVGVALVNGVAGTEVVAGMLVAGAGAMGAT